MKYIVLLLTIAFSASLHGQITQGKDSAYLDVNNWKVNLKTSMSHGHGEMPKTTDTSQTAPSPLFAWALWCGGLHNGNIFPVQAETYRQFLRSDNAVGPVNDSGLAISDPVRAAYWDKMHKVNDWEVNQHLNGKQVLAVDNWPGNGDASFNEPAQVGDFRDLNNNDVYEPGNGETPGMKGNQMLYSVNNDAIIKSVTGSPILPLETHMYAYGFNCKEGILDNTFFMDYYLINKSKLDIDSFYVGMWSDMDIGGYYDDAMGSIPQKGFFAYNYDDSDDVYVDSIPMISVYPVSHDLSKFIYYNNDFTVTGNPENDRPGDFYNYLRGRWKNGGCVRRGGDGYHINDSFPCTDFMFDGNPFDTSSWSMTNERAFGRDIRGVGSVLYPTFKAGDTIKITWAFSAHWKHHDDRAKQYLTMIDDIDYVKGLYKNNGFDNLCKTPLGVRQPESASQAVVYPNPSSGLFHIASDEEQQYDIYNSSGQLVKTLTVNGKTSFNLSHKGIYLLKERNSGQQSRLVVY